MISQIQAWKPRNKEANPKLFKKSLKSQLTSNNTVTKWENMGENSNDGVSLAVKIKKTFLIYHLNCKIISV